MSDRAWQRKYDKLLLEFRNLERERDYWRQEALESEWRYFRKLRADLEQALNE